MTGVLIRKRRDIMSLSASCGTKVHINCYKLPFLFWVWFPHFRGFPSLWAQIKENKTTICRWLIKISQLCSMPNLKKWRLKIKFCSTFKIIYHSIEIYIFILPKEARKSVPLNFFKNSFFSPIPPLSHVQ